MATTYRAEVVGSLLRPDYLKEARVARDEGRLSEDEFKQVEDQAVDEAIALQEGADVDIVTDGEMRRYIFTAQLTEAVEGLSRTAPHTIRWHGDTPEDDWDFENPVAVTGKLRRRRSLATEEFSYARDKASKPVKMTLPSPLMLSLFWSPEHSTEVYDDPFELFEDAAEIIRNEARELEELGCTYIQIDAPELATLVDESQRAHYEGIGISPERMLTDGVELLDSIPQGTPDVIYGFHLCRGNNQGRWMSRGGYESISKEVFKRASSYDVFLLEYDDPRSGSFEPLADIPHDKTAVLGLVSTKHDRLEEADELMAHIKEAGRHFPQEQLAVSTQCGFASTASGNPISPQTQEAKLRRVAEVARRAW